MEPSFSVEAVAIAAAAKLSNDGSHPVWVYTHLEAKAGD